MSDLQLPPFKEIIGEPWIFGQPEEAGDYEWWSPIHSMDVGHPTIFTGYDGNVRGWGRDVWYRKIPASSVWRYSGWHVGRPLHGARCHAFISVVDDVIHCDTANWTPSFMVGLNGTSFAALVKSLLFQPKGNYLNYLARVNPVRAEFCKGTFNEAANGS